MKLVIFSEIISKESVEDVAWLFLLILKYNRRENS